MPSGPGPETIAGADLSTLSTFRLPARAAELVVIDHPEQLAAVADPSGPQRMLGDGSNTVFLSDYPGRIVLNRLRGISFSPCGKNVLVTAAAGENWHRLVRHCLDHGLYGIENLVMIPGSVGAAPMQNIGAYGVELADVFESLRAYDRQRGRLVTLDRGACRFGYRDSRFKSHEPERFMISEVTLRLSKGFVPRTGYPSLADALRRAGTDRPQPRQLAAAVMRLRRHRLPDPARLPNAGSFFKNPVVDTDTAAALLAAWPALPRWPMADGSVKLGAAWMIEQLGWKGRRIGQAGVYHHHALVLVNHGNASGADLLALIAAITDSVRARFGLVLEPEPALIDEAQATAGQERA